MLTEDALKEMLLQFRYAETALVHILLYYHVISEWKCYTNKFFQEVVISKTKEKTHFKNLKLFLHILRWMPYQIWHLTLFINQVVIFYNKSSCYIPGTDKESSHHLVQAVCQVLHISCGFERGKTLNYPITREILH